MCGIRTTDTTGLCLYTARGGGGGAGGKIRFRACGFNTLARSE